MLETKKFYGVIRVSDGGNYSMIERLFTTEDEAETYATNAELAPYARDRFSIVEVKYNPNFM